MEKSLPEKVVTADEFRDPEFVGHLRVEKSWRTGHSGPWHYGESMLDMMKRLGAK